MPAQHSSHLDKKQYKMLKVQVQQCSSSAGRAVHDKQRYTALHPHTNRLQQQRIHCLWSKMAPFMLCKIAVHATSNFQQRKSIPSPELLASADEQAR